MSNTHRLYHFVCDDFGFQNIQNRRLKLSFPDQVNDLFEFMPFDFGKEDEGRRRRLFWQTARAEYSKTQGFISFSKHWSVPTMWAHYANNHGGICLGFDLPQSLDIGVPYAKVDYEETLMPLDSKVEDDHTYKDEMVHYASKTKSQHWQYENEWRYWFSLSPSEIKQKAADPNKLFFADFGDDLVLKDVILGHRSKLSSNCLKELLKSTDKVKFTTARPSFREFKMVSQLEPRHQK